MTGVCLGWLIKMQTAEMIQNTVERSSYRRYIYFLLGDFHLWNNGDILNIKRQESTTKMEKLFGSILFAFCRFGSFQEVISECYSV